MKRDASLCGGLAVMVSSDVNCNHGLTLVHSVLGDMISLLTVNFFSLRMLVCQ